MVTHKSCSHWLLDCESVQCYCICVFAGIMHMYSRMHTKMCLGMDWGEPRTVHTEMSLVIWVIDCGKLQTGYNMHKDEPRNHGLGKAILWTQRWIYLFIYLLVLFKQGSSSVPKLCSPWKIDSYIQLMDQVMDWGESQTVDTKTGIVMDLWEPQTGAQRMA